MTGPAEPSVTTGDPVLEAADLARHYEIRRGLFAGRATVKALAGASFTLARGRTLAVVGESGCGKSTLARLITLIEPPTAGTLAFDGADVTGADGEGRLRCYHPLDRGPLDRGPLDGGRPAGAASGGEGEAA